MRRALKRGAIVGLLAGLFVLAGVVAASWRCLPFRISLPPIPWPWYCADPAFTAIGYLALPVNLLTNDLSQAVGLAPLALMSYAILGALIGLGLEQMRPSGAWRQTGGQRDGIDRRPARKRGRGEGGVQDDPARRRTGA